MRERRPYTVKLAAVGNPDLGQARYLPGVRSRTVRAASFEEASKLCRAFIAEHNLGAGNWAGGEVRDHTRALVATVSYNGTVWPPNAWTSRLAPLWPVAVAS